MRGRRCVSRPTLPSGSDAARSEEGDPSPSASSCFSRPEPPPLKAFGGPRTATVVQRSVLHTVPVAARSTSTMISPVEVMAPPARRAP